MYSMEEPKSAPPTGVSPSTPPPGPLLAAPSDTANIPASHAGAPVNQVNQVNPAVDDWVSVNATHGLLNTRLPPFESRDDSPTSPVFPFRAHVRKPTGADLQVQTGLDPYTTAAEFQSEHSPDTLEANTGDQLRHSATAPIAIQDGRLRSNLSAWSMSGSLSPGSTISSPALHALTDLTPLPSPLLMASSPGPWSRAAMRPRSRGASSSSSKDDAFAMLTNGTLSPSPSLKKKGYQKLRTAAVEAAAASMQTEHNNEASRERNRSISEFVPEALRNIHARHVTISNVTPEQFESRTGSEPQLHREAYLAAQRGLVSGPAATGLPTPPASNASVRSVTESEGEEAADDDKTEYLMVRHGLQKTKKYWRPVRQLGQGTFSKVYLATSEKLAAKDPLDESVLDPHKLVAIKVVEHGPAGGADEQRVELSLKREVEMLRSVSHPSLVHLREFDHGDAQALLVLTYCPGGDLFDVATAHRELLNVDFVQRIFAEMVSAVRYLHDKLIVHRDIKLENVLLNLPVATVPLLKDPISHPYPIATLTDLGLSRRIPAPPESPLLTTRCGSEDYAAPEILLGQPYDGRCTDAWALGVVLYALMEGRLPFDPPPGKVGSRSRAAHRIARCDWMWVKFGDEDGEWDVEKGQEWAGARECVEGLLKKISRGRKSLADIEKMAWVRGGIKVDGGIRRRIEDEDDAEAEMAEVTKR